MKTACVLSGALTITFVLAAVAARAQAPAAALALLNQKPELSAARTLSVTSADFPEGGAIPLEDTAYGASRSPSLSISGAPAATRVFAIVMEDTDAQRDGALILHWLAYDLPASTPAIPAGIPAGESLSEPVALRQGKTTAGQNAYRGPHPPQPPKGPHHYHIEVFALDTVLPPVEDRAALAQAMAGHVLAQGELVATFTAPAQ